VSGVGGEFALIDRLRASVRGHHPDVETGIGDDAAVLAGGWCLTTDLLVEDVHFRPAATSLEDLGWKALAVNLSDLAAMGASPVAALSALALPARDAEATATALTAGLDACAQAYGLELAGGDVTTSPVLVIAVTAAGRAEHPIRRDGGRVGDALAVTGALGGARAALALLALDPARDDALAERLRRPRPRLDEGYALTGIAHAMLDLSDGLAGDAERLAAASGLAAHVDLDAVPVEPGVESVAEAAGRAPGWYAAAGGEDYELLVAAPAAALAGSGVPLTVIGELTDGPAGQVTFTGAGSDDPPRGFDHLA
jgi:thiamine-monophosphate kinase